jgi:elongation factor G
MKKIDIANVRTFEVMGHSGSGKTTLIDALLFKLGVNDRLGLVDSGSSMADYTEAEKSRKITIEAKPFSAVFKSASGKEAGMVFCDTPGYMDFYGQVIAASSVCDSALIVVDATDGVQAGTSKSWRRANELEQPRAIVITGLDRENADFPGTLKKIQEVWGKKCVPVTLPLADGKGVADILDTKDLPDDVASQAEEIKNNLVESAAETDDSLIEKYLGGETLSAEEIADGLRQSVLNCQIVPIFVCAPLKDVGLDELLEGIVRLLPSPAECKMKDAEGNEIDPSPDAPFSGFVWRTASDPHVGQLAFLKVCGGTLKADSEVMNCTKGKKERIATILSVNGKKQSTVDEATAGDIVTLTKLKHTELNDVLCASGHKVSFKALSFPNALVSYAVRAKSRGDEDKIGVALSRVVSADPTVRVMQNSETHEIILSGMGNVHIEVAVEQMKSRSNVEVELSAPKIPYRETVTGRGEGRYKHKKQSGGHGQYAEVYLFAEAKQPGDEEEWFVNKIVGGAIPTNFIPAVQKGLVEGMTSGTIAGYPVHNVKVTVYDGTFHEVDSSEVAFKIASSRAFKEAMTNAKPVLLEPIMKVKIMVPERFMGDVSGDISHKRGHILGVSLEEGMQVITAEAPHGELSHYCAELRSMTAGEGSFELEHARYDVVPGNIATKIVAAATKEKEEKD